MTYQIRIVSIARMIVVVNAPRLAGFLGSLPTLRASGPGLLTQPGNCDGSADRVQHINNVAYSHRLVVSFLLTSFLSYPPLLRRLLQRPESVVERRNDSCGPSKNRYFEFDLSGGTDANIHTQSIRLGSQLRY